MKANNFACSKCGGIGGYHFPHCKHSQRVPVTEEVQHKDGDPRNNDLWNLEIKRTPKTGENSK